MKKTILTLLFVFSLMLFGHAKDYEKIDKFTNSEQTLVQKADVEGYSTTRPALSNNFDIEYSKKMNIPIQHKVIVGSLDEVSFNIYHWKIYGLLSRQKDKSLNLPMINKIYYDNNRGKIFLNKLVYVIKIKKVATNMNVPL